MKACTMPSRSRAACPSIAATSRATATPGLAGSPRRVACGAHQPECDHVPDRNRGHQQLVPPHQSWPALRPRAGALALAGWIGLTSAAGGLLATAVPPPAAAGVAGTEIIRGQARVVDGDTLVVDNKRIRLYGVDAPEKAQACGDASGREYACGQASLQALKARIRDRVVTCEVKNLDQYGREVAACSVESPATKQQEDIGDWMVRNGHAVAYRSYSKRYVNAEAEAQAERRGVWAGTFQEPKDWRKANKRGGNGNGSNGNVSKAA